MHRNILYRLPEVKSSCAMGEEHHIDLSFLDHTLGNRSHILLVIMAAVVGAYVTNCDKIHEVVLTGRVHQVVADHLVHGVHRVLKSEGHEAGDAMGDLIDDVIGFKEGTSSNGEK